jgi:hypothetical protein
VWLRAPLDRQRFKHEAGVLTGVLTGQVITGVNIPTAIPLVYKIDPKTMKPVKVEGAYGPLSGRYVGDQAISATPAAPETRTALEVAGVASEVARHACEGRAEPERPADRVRD